MKDFDWRTEERDDQLFESPEAAADPVIRRYRRKLLALLGILALIVSGIYWQLDRRADIQEGVFEAEVLAAFNVWQQAVARSDEELFNALLVGTQPAWATTQRSLFHADLLMGRSQLDLALAAEENGLKVANVKVELAPDWMSAALSFEQVYSVIDHSGDSLSAPPEVRLGQELAFRRNADRWFLAEPAEDFWGEWQTEEKALVTLTYPERDEEWALRLAQDLNAELTAVCGRLPAGVCDERETIELRMETKSVSPVLWRGWEPALMDGRIFIVPAFSLVGSPVDEAGYELLYRFYTGPILDIFTAWVDTPVALPDQELQLICYTPDGRVPRLIRFISANEWIVDLPEESFRYLSPMATDEGLILQQYLPGRDSSHLRLVYWEAGQERLVYDGNFSHLMLYPVGWTGGQAEPNLLLHGYGENPTFTRYSHIDLDDCDPAGCRVDELEGFPVWSPDGRHTILQQAGTLMLGDGDGVPEQVVGPGVTPFWLGNEHFGYLRYLGGEESEVLSGRMEIVTAEVSDLSPKRLLTTENIGAQVSQPELATSYISHVFVSQVSDNPVDVYRLFVAVRSYDNDQQGVHIFSVMLGNRAGTIVVGEISAEITLAENIVGYPSLAAPNGFVPFVVSPDGRWLSAAQPSPDKADTWLIYVRDTEEGRMYVYEVGYPSSMFIHPYYDWSKDGKWLVIVEQNFLRLIAPEHHYERVIPHELQNCSHVAWVG